ncbi:MAG: SMP-30/gluconolactonase/LRE family protein [Deltaproteobacteria bacterium]|jgi:D-xylono/L-arabinono-1,4-lactonase|nr:SMP-30/gluconolactonase/LRE family protein [Deltaproteobacteria bacterium]
MIQPELIADYRCHIGENPLWHPLEQRLYWTDITRGTLFRYDPATGKHEPCHSGAPVGGFTVQADGTLLLFMARGAIAQWRDGHLNYILDEIPDERESRFNDVIADPVGRVFCGTMPTPARPGRLYRLDLDGGLQVLLEGIGVSNGMGFTLDRQRMYFTDSAARSIYLFDYDDQTGGLTNQRVWLHTPEGAGVPDGMTVDAEGYVWSARWDGSALYRYTPEGVEERRIEFPAKKVSSVAFGGDELSDLYVTTALTDSTKAEEGAGAGALFRLRLGMRGLPEFFSRVRI